MAFLYNAIYIGTSTVSLAVRNVVKLVTNTTWILLEVSPADGRKAFLTMATHCHRQRRRWRSFPRRPSCCSLSPSSRSLQSSPLSRLSLWWTSPLPSSSSSRSSSSLSRHCKRRKDEKNYRESVIIGTAHHRRTMPKKNTGRRALHHTEVWCTKFDLKPLY